MTVYDGQPGSGYEVVFMDNTTGKRLARFFSSLYLAQKFANKLRFSKKCTLISYPGGIL